MNNIILLIFLLFSVNVFASQDSVQDVTMPILHYDGIKTGDNIDVTVTFSVLDQGSSAPADVSNNTIFPLTDIEGNLTGAYVVVTAQYKRKPPAIELPLYNLSDEKTGQTLRIYAVTAPSGIEILDSSGSGTGSYVDVTVMSNEQD